jgi:hypothetical protein
MAEYVGLNAQVPDILPKMSQLLQIQSQRTQLASEQQSLQQRQNLAKYDWNKHIGSDGTLDLNTLNDPELMAAAGDQYQDVLAKAIQAKTSQLESKRTLTALRGDQREAFGEMMNALRSDKDVAEDSEKGRQKVNEAMIQYGEMYGEDVLPVLTAYAAPLQKAPKGRLGDALRAIGLQSMDASQQVSAQQPNYLNTGGAAVQVNPLSPGASPAAPTIPMTLAPGQQDVVQVDQLGNPYRTIRTPQGQVAGTAPLPGTGGTGAPATFGVGERASFEAQAEKNFENITANRQAASMAPQQLDQINKALDLSRDVSTGAWAAKRAQIESGIGSLIPGYQGMDDATKLQELDKFAERIATDASRVLGVNAKTDAERESIHKQNANIGYTPKAIQAVLQYAKAQTLAMESKGNAQEAWLATQGNGITKQHEFETRFRQAYDPRVFQYVVMDADERKKFSESLSKEDKADIAKKTRALRELGALPGG